MEAVIRLCTAALMVFWAIPAANAEQNQKLCPEKLSSYVAGRSDFDSRPHFELRRCNGTLLQIAGFKQNERQPSLLIDTGQSSTALVIHNGDVLLIGVAAGSSTQTYVLQIRKGIPRLLDQVDGIDDISYREEHSEKGDFVIFSIPRKTYPDEKGIRPKVPPRVFRLETYDSEQH